MGRPVGKTTNVNSLIVDQLTRKKSLLICLLLTILHIDKMTCIPKVQSIPCLSMRYLQYYNINKDNTNSTMRNKMGLYWKIITNESGINYEPWFKYCTKHGMDIKKNANFHILPFLWHFTFASFKGTEVHQFIGWPRRYT